MNRFRRHRERAIVSFGIFATLWGVGNMSFFTMPHLIEGLVSGGMGLSESRAGLVGTIELMFLAGTIIVLSPRMGNIARRRLALIGMSIAAAGFFASSLFDQIPLIIACRVVAGVGAGCAMAAANAAIASLDEPEQVYAWTFMLGSPVQAVLISVMPYFVASGGHSGAYAYQATWALGFIAIAWFLFPKDVAAAETTVEEKWAPKFLEIVMIFAIFLFLIGDGGTWSFAERVAISIGIDIHTYGRVLGVAVLVVPLGAALASAVGLRFGRYWPLAIGLSGMAASVYVLTHTAVQGVLMGAQLSYNFVYAFALPFVYGTAAAMDPKGRVIVAAMGVGLIGGALAPFLSGVLAETTGTYETLGVVYGGIFLSVLVLTILVGRTLPPPES